MRAPTRRLHGDGSDAGARGHDRGSGTVLVLGAIGALTALLVGGLALASAAHAAGRARAAADLGALAGAQALVDAAGGRPCTAAGDVVRRNGARLLSCQGLDGVVDVRVAVPAVGRIGTATARARAGPDPDGPAFDPGGPASPVTAGPGHASGAHR